jgi:hypothetical protein
MPPLSIMLLLFFDNGGYGTLIWASQTKPPHVAASSLKSAAFLPFPRQRCKLNQICCHRCPSCCLSNCSLKGTGSRDGLKLSLHSWAGLCRFLKDLGRFLNFLDAPIFGQKYSYIPCGKCETFAFLQP